MEHGQCTLCGERGHVASGCPDLCSPLKEGFRAKGSKSQPEDLSRCVPIGSQLVKPLEGFQGGGGGGGSHSHDDEKNVCCLLPQITERYYIQYNLS